MANEINLSLINQLKDSKSEEDRRKCIPLLQQHLSSHPDDALAWYDLACCFDFIGSELEAEPCYKKTFELGYDKLPTHQQPGFFVGFGSTLRNNLKFDESQAVLQKAVETFPDAPALKVFLAFTLYSQGKYRPAAEALFQALGGLKEKVFDGYDRAIQWYAENLEIHPTFPLPPSLETERLLLRPLTDEDAPAIFEYCRDPEVSKFTTWMPHKTIDDSKVLVDYAKKNYRSNLPEPYGITLKSNPQKVVGTVGWFWVSEKNKCIELAYALSRNLWGQGLVFEASRALINQALRERDIYRISARCRVENIASSRVMEKLGMKYEGTQRGLIFIKGHHLDLKNYGMLREEWINLFGIN